MFVDRNDFAPFLFHYQCSISSVAKVNKGANILVEWTLSKTTATEEEAFKDKLISKQNACFCETTFKNVSFKNNYNTVWIERGCAENVDGSR